MKKYFIKKRLSSDERTVYDLYEILGNEEDENLNSKSIINIYSSLEEAKEGLKFHLSIENEKEIYFDENGDEIKEGENS